MKDLIAKLQMDANCALGAIWMHIDAREKHIAELERQLQDHSAQAFSIGETYANALSRIAELEAQIAAKPADTDKLREAILALPLPAPTHLPYGLRYSGGDMQQLLELAADTAASTALQAPVREVPGYKLVPLEVTDAMLEAWKHELCIPVGSSPEAKARRAYKAMLAAAPLPAAPVQQEGE